MAGLGRSIWASLTKSSRPYAIAVLVVALPLVGWKTAEYGYRDVIARNTILSIRNNGEVKGENMLAANGAPITPRNPPFCTSGGTVEADCKSQFMRKVEIDPRGEVTVWLTGELRLQQGKLMLEGHRMVLSPVISGGSVEWSCRSDVNHKFVRQTCSPLTQIENSR